MPGSWLLLELYMWVHASACGDSWGAFPAPGVLPDEVGAPLLHPPPTCGLLCNNNDALMLITSTIAGPQEESIGSLNVSELVNNKNQESHPNMSDTRFMRFSIE